MLGINGGEFVLLLVVALVVVGPERLPRYAEQLGIWVRTARRFALEAKERVTEELGEDVGDVDWAALDPRRYDPRRIVREALLDDTPPSVATAAPRPTAAAARAAGAATAAGKAGTGARTGTGTGTGNGTGTAAGNGATGATGTGATGATGSPATGDGTAAEPARTPGAGPAPAPFDDEAT